jgi:hypothetical protein
MAADRIMADESVPSSPTEPGQSAAITECAMRAAGIRVVPVMFGRVVVVDEDVVVSALTPPGAACGREDDPEWQPARMRGPTATSAAIVRFIWPFYPRLSEM